MFLRYLHSPKVWIPDENNSTGMPLTDLSHVGSTKLIVVYHAEVFPSIYGVLSIDIARSITHNVAGNLGKGQKIRLTFPVGSDILDIERLIGAPLEDFEGCHILGTG